MLLTEAIQHAQGLHKKVLSTWGILCCGGANAVHWQRPQKKLPTSSRSRPKWSRWRGEKNIYCVVMFLCIRQVSSENSLLCSSRVLKFILILVKTTMVHYLASGSSS